MRKVSKFVFFLAFFIILVGIGVFINKEKPWMRWVHENQGKGVYYCPMHPSYTSDRPGDCPICNMKLVKKENGEVKKDLSKSGVVGLSPSATLKDVCFRHQCPMVKEGKPCPMLVVAKEGEKVICPVCGSFIVGKAGELIKTKKILYWTDPMMPGYQSDKPGKSPMGMDLTPVYEEEQAPLAESMTVPKGYTPILVSPQKQQMIGIRTASIHKRLMTKTIRTVGRIAYDPELYQAEEEYLQALKAYQQAQQGANQEVMGQAEKLVESSQMRLRLLGLNQEIINEMPEWKGPDKSLLSVDAEGHVWVYASIYEYELPMVRVGQIMQIEVPSVSGKVFEGVVKSIDTLIDTQTRSAKVRAILTDKEGVLKPEMYVNAKISVPLGEVLTVPDQAVFDTGDHKIIFVDKGEGIFEPRDVVVGTESDGYSEVKSGVAEGEIVVINGNFLIDSESRLKAAMDGMGAGTHQHGQ